MVWTRWANVLLGVWLIVAPFVIGYSARSTSAAVEDVILGILIGGCSLWMATGTKVPAFMSWLVGLFGLWVLIAPFALGYRAVTSALANDVIVGILVLILAIAQVGYAAPRGLKQPT